MKNTIARYRLLILIVILGSSLRVYHLGERSLWYDEAIVVLESQKDVSAITSVDSEGIHPPLYRLIMRAMMLWGHAEEEFQLRFLPVLFSILSILMMYFLARGLFDKKTGLITALLMAISPLQIYYAQEVKMYALLLLLTLLSTYFFICLLRNNRRRDWIFYVVFSLGAIYTNYLAILTLFVHGLSILFFYKQLRSFWWRWVGSQCVLSLFFAPWLATFFDHVQRVCYKFWIPPVGFSEIRDFFRHFAIGYYFTPAMGIFAETVCGLLLVYGVIETFGVSVRLRLGQVNSILKINSLLVFVGLVVPVSISLLFSWFVRPVFITRSLLICTPFYYMLLAKGIEQLHKKKIVLILSVSSLIFLSGYGVYNYFSDKHFTYPTGVARKKPIREAVGYILKHYQKGDKVILSHHSLWPSFQYYCRSRKDFVYLPIYLEDLQYDFSLYALRQSMRLEDVVIEDIVPKARRIWVVVSSWHNQPFYISAPLKAWMDKQKLISKSEAFRGMWIYCFNKSEQ